MNSNLDNLTAANLRRAADITDQIESLQAELAQILSGKKKPGRKPGKKAAAKKKRASKKTGAGKRKVAKKKTAKKKTAKKKAASKKAKRPLSASARKAMSEARKAYWANKRKETGKK